MSGSLFVTSNEQPTSSFNPAPPVIESSVSEVASLPDKDKKLLEKQSGITIRTDKDLADAKSSVFSQHGANNETLRTAEATVEVSADVNDVGVVQGALTGATEVAGNTTASIGSALDYAKEKLEIGTEAIDLCKKFELDGASCPICPEFPDLLGGFNELSAKFAFNDVLDKILGFGDSSLFTMLVRCPEYLLTTASSKLGVISGKISDANDSKMMEALVSVTGKDKIPDLGAKVKAMSGGVIQTQDNIDKYNTIVTQTGGNKQDMVTKQPTGLNERAVKVDDTVTGSNLGTKLFADVIDEDTQNMARTLSDYLKKNPPPEETPRTSTVERVEQQKKRKQEIATPLPTPVLV